MKNKETRPQTCTLQRKYPSDEEEKTCALSHSLTLPLLSSICVHARLAMEMRVSVFNLILNLHCLWTASIPFFFNQPSLLFSFIRRICNAKIWVSYLGGLGGKKAVKPSPWPFPFTLYFKPLSLAQWRHNPHWERPLFCLPFPSWYSQGQGFSVALCPGLCF